MGDVYEELLVKRNATAWEKIQKPLIFALTAVFLIGSLVSTSSMSTPTQTARWTSTPSSPSRAASIRTP